MNNNTWILTFLPSGCKVVGCKWVLKNNYNVDVSFQKHKARLVAKGFSQTAGTDYNETYSPVFKPTTIRVVFSHVVYVAWPIHQIEVNNVFLNGDLHEDVYMQQPPSFQSSSSNLVYKLSKAIYGLKQASRSWFEKLRSTFESIIFHPIKSDTSIFIKFNPSYTIFILIYVDDIVITGCSTSYIQDPKHTLGFFFALKDLGHLIIFLASKFNISKMQVFFYLRPNISMIFFSEPTCTKLILFQPPCKLLFVYQRMFLRLFKIPPYITLSSVLYSIFSSHALSFLTLSTRFASSCQILRNTIGKQSNVSYDTLPELQCTVCLSNAVYPRTSLLSMMHTRAVM